MSIAETTDRLNDIKDGMNYESPIELIVGEMEHQIADNMFKVIQSYDIKVDKDELIKALHYDRKQYEKGYEEGYKAGYDIGCEHGAKYSEICGAELEDEI